MKEGASGGEKGKRIGCKIMAWQGSVHVLGKGDGTANSLLVTATFSARTKNLNSPRASEIRPIHTLIDFFIYLITIHYSIIYRLSNPTSLT